MCCSLLWINIMANVFRACSRQPPWAPQTGEGRPRRHTGGQVQVKIKQLYARGSKSKLYGSPKVKENEMNGKGFSIVGAPLHYIIPLTSGFQKHPIDHPRCFMHHTHPCTFIQTQPWEDDKNVGITNKTQICRGTAHAHRCLITDRWGQKVKYPQSGI